jgi:rhodanese-related sulfurtransferase
MILAKVSRDNAGNALIVGGGFIGVEVAENLRLRGWNVAMVEMLPQILPQFDEEVALYVQRHMEKNCVKVLTCTQMTAICKSGGGLRVSTTGGDMDADIVLMSVGVRPNSELAKSAGLELGPKDAVKVDGSGRTSDPHIFASGDCATVCDLATGRDAWAPMGSTANKQARAAALTLTGQDTEFAGVLGTMAVKAFEVSAAKTGLSEREALACGHDIVSALVPADDRAHYYPGSAKIAIKVVAERGSGKMLGAQAYGFGTVDKPIDAFVVALTMGATVYDLANADFAYAPPFSTAINPVNLACHVLLNKMQGKLDGVGCTAALKEVEDPSWNGLILDTREIPEFMLGSLPGAVNIPLVELAPRLSEIEAYKDKPVLVVCNYGKSAYDGYLRLRHLGFNRVKILEGGTRFWPYKLE